MKTQSREIIILEIPVGAAHFQSRFPDRTSSFGYGCFQTFRFR